MANFYDEVFCKKTKQKQSTTKNWELFYKNYFIIDVFTNITFKEVLNKNKLSRYSIGQISHCKSKLLSEKDLSNARESVLLLS